MDEETEHELTEMRIRMNDLEMRIQEVERRLSQGPMVLPSDIVAKLGGSFPGAIKPK